MTEKQKIFADEYLIDLNATRAYRVAYPNVKKDDTAAVNGSKLLRNTKVAEYIQERMQERQQRTEVTQDRVVQELAAIDYSSDRVQTSPTGDALPRIIAKIIDLQEEINADIDRFIDLKAEVMHVIDILPADEQEILYGKYFEYKTMPTIAAEIPCSIRNAQRLHRQALEHLSKLPCFVTSEVTP